MCDVKVAAATQSASQLTSLRAAGSGLLLLPLLLLALPRVVISSQGPPHIRQAAVPPTRICGPRLLARAALVVAPLALGPRRPL